MAVDRPADADDVDRDRWSAETAWAWWRSRPWPCGANYVPSTAVNATEMWQAATFDPATVDRELGWAAALGLNSVRVFLQYVALYVSCYSKRSLVYFENDMVNVTAAAHLN